MIAACSLTNVFVDFVFKVDICLCLSIKLDGVIMVVDIRRNRGLFKCGLVHFFTPAAPLGIYIYDKLPGFNLIFSLCLFPCEPVNLCICRNEAAKANYQSK